MGIKLTNSGKLTYQKCPYCGATDVWFTNYINFGAPNVYCKSCSREFTISTETNLEVISNDTHSEDKC